MDVGPGQKEGGQQINLKPTKQKGQLQPGVRLFSQTGLLQRVALTGRVSVPEKQVKDHQELPTKIMRGQGQKASKGKEKEAGYQQVAALA